MGANSEAGIVGPQIVQRARSYVGTPFFPGGRSVQGLDCGGLILRVAEDLGLPLPPVRNYHAAFDSGCLSDYLKPSCERVDLEAGLAIFRGEGIEPGDFLVFSLAKGVQHLGIASGEGTFIHAWDSPSVHAVVEIPLDAFWTDRLIQVWRLKETADD